MDFHLLDCFFEHGHYYFYWAPTINKLELGRGNIHESKAYAHICICSFVFVIKWCKNLHPWLIESQEETAHLS